MSVIFKLKQDIKKINYPNRKVLLDSSYATVIFLTFVHFCKSNFETI